MKRVIISLLIFALLPLSGCGANQEQNGNGNELTIAAFYNSRYLEYAAQKYEELHEGVKININYYATEDDKDYSKYSQIINTALMSGKGEDIIDVSTLAWTKLADKNKLLDLNGEIDFENDTYYQNILDAYLYNGKRHTIPLCFAFEAFRFDESFNEKANALTLNDLLSLAERNHETALFSEIGRLGLAYMLFDMSFNEFIDIGNKAANVDSEKFISLLEAVNSLENRLSTQNSGDVPLIRQYFLYTPVMTNAGTIDYTDLFLLTDDNENTLFTTIGFLPAVNANSGANKDLAVDFIRFLLSEEMQSSTELLFCPVNKKAAAEMAALTLADVQAGGHAPDGFSNNSFESNITIFNELAQGLTVVKHSDHFINDFVVAELMRYFQGEVSAEQAAKSLQSRLNTYLKE